MGCAGSLLEEAAAPADRLEWSNASGSPQSGTVSVAYLQLREHLTPCKR